MTLDVELRERLHDVAGRVHVEDPPVSRFVRRGRRRGRTKIVGVLSSVVVLLAGAGVLGSYVSRPRAPLHSYAGESLREPRPAHGRAAEWVASGESLAGTSEETRYGFLDEDAVIAGPAAPAPQPRSPAPDAGVSSEVGGIGPRIVKAARIELEVDEGQFQRRFADARAVAADYRGFVTASATEGEDARSGRVVIRVPVARFEAAMNDLTALGVLRAEEVRGTDVTEEYVDLQGRLKVLTRHQRFLYRKLDQTNSIGESIRIREMIEDVQFDIERHRGQLRLLRDQSNFATIDVSMYEVGNGPEEVEGASPLAGAWDRALHGTQTVLAAIVVGLGYLLPILILLLLLWLGARQVRARIA